MSTSQQAIQVTLFPALSERGKEFAHLLERAMSQLTLGGWAIRFQAVEGGEQGDMVAAGLRDDVVIIDGSVEDAIGTNYGPVNMFPCSMDHFLVVSRTRLPLNFQPFVPGGFPDTFGSPRARPDTRTNAQLVDWTVLQIRSMTPRLPRPRDERLTFDQASMTSQFVASQRLIQTLVGNSIRRKQQKATTRAFVSYLSRYSRHHRSPTRFGHGFMEDAMACLGRTRSIAEENIVYHPPGSLSSEFMTEHRRWQVVALILQRILEVDEFWILATDDYYDSWWTLAELALLSVFRDPAAAKPRVMQLRPGASGEWVATPDDGLPTPSSRQAQEFNRLISNSDPRTMGRETIPGTRRLARMLKPLQWLFFQAARPLTGAVMKKWAADFRDEGQDAAKPAPSRWRWRQFQDMLRSPVNEESFWTDRIVTCPRCSGENDRRARFDFEELLNHRLQGQSRVSASQMQAILEDGFWCCPSASCQQRYEIVRLPQDQFFWWPRRVRLRSLLRAERVATGPGGVLIERKPVYELLAG